MNYLAIDLGAESGRVILGTLKDGRITLEEIERFPNIPIREGPSIRWDFCALLENIFGAVHEAATRFEKSGEILASLSADSWGVDYVFINEKAHPFVPVFHYRDPRTTWSAPEFLAKVPWPTVFAETGIQYMPINTLFQLAAEPASRIQNASRILSIADFVNRELGGAARIEESMASTFQMYNPRTRNWSPLLLEKLGIPRDKLGDVVPSGSVLGEINAQCFPPFRGAKVIATCSHDTGAAVAAVPATLDQPWAYVSSGTWSLMGVERAEPIINDLARELNFTNEIGYGGSIRLLKNISGLWLLQECRRAWADAGNNFDYAELTRLAESEQPFRSLIQPMDPRFLAPAKMTDAIAAFCRETAQPLPETPAQFTRCIFESLALLYRQTLLQLEQLTGEKLEVLHIVGGGSKNTLLNQFTANACQIPVLAGPVEATALGNILIQAITLGEVGDLKSARELIRQNFATARFEPTDRAAWSNGFDRFLQLSAAP